MKIHFNFLRAVASSDVTGGPRFICELIVPKCLLRCKPRFSISIKNGNSCMSVVPNTWALEQPEYKKQNIR